MEKVGSFIPKGNQFLWNLFLQTHGHSGLFCVQKSMFAYTLVVYAANLWMLKLYMCMYTIPVCYSSVSNAHNLHFTLNIFVVFEYMTQFFLPICK